MRLSGANLRQLHEAIEAGFSPNEMNRLLLERFDKPLYLFAANDDFSVQVVQVAQYFNKRYIAEQLIAALRDARPHEPALIALADTAGFTVMGRGLEAYLIPDQAHPADAVDFRIRLGQCENAVCRIEIGSARGTGVLIGPDMVLTNHHVVPVAEDGALPGAVRCLFDHKTGANGYTTPTSAVKAVRAVAWSPHAPEDVIRGAMASDPGRLDYTLLALETAVGSQPIVSGFDPRDFVRVDPDLAPPVEHTGILILQHPLAQPMKIDLGSVTRVGSTRIWHDAGTNHGSSGSPLFDARLRLVGLHNAGHGPDGDRPAYNQAVPMSLIAADLVEKQISLVG